MSRPIANTDARIDENGNVFSSKGYEVIKSIRLSGAVCVRVFNTKTYKFTRLNVGRAILDAYRPVKDSVWKSVVFIDGDQTNCKLSNLRWDDLGYMPPKGSNNREDVTTQYPIPGYPGYTVDLNGRVRSATGKLCAARCREGGRLSVTLVYDGQSRYAAVARILALTFIPHPLDVDHLVVNHIDGNPSNNALSNLEWCTSGYNNRHAFETGLRFTPGVVMKNVETGEIKEFPTLPLAAEFLGTKSNTLHVYITAKLVRKFTPYNGWMCKTGLDETPWPSEDDRGATPVPEVFCAYNYTTGEMLVSPICKMLAREVGLSDSTVRVLAQGKPKAWKGWMFKTCHPDQVDGLTWPVYPKWVLALMERMDRPCNPIRVTDLDAGSTACYLGVKYWCRETGQKTDPAVICRALKLSNRWSHYRFEFIDVYDTAITACKAKMVKNVSHSMET